METSLHRQLKIRYATSEEQTEVTIDGFRIDAISDSNELIEIQHASLGALRDKTRKLLDSSDRSLRIVKPIVARKRLTTLTRKGGKVKRTRMSSKRGEVLDLFDDLVHFATLFPRNRLTLEIVLIELHEFRVDRGVSNWRKKRYECLDQELLRVRDSIELRTNADLLALLPIERLPNRFDTAELGVALGKPRWLAQKVAYCLRKTGAAAVAGKRGKSRLYRIAGIEEEAA
ncbi:MAG: hypothetical protein ACE5GX_04185 [Thermoanaerobaculia bacterium]